jgi:hypothetical protein
LTLRENNLPETQKRQHENEKKRVSPRRGILCAAETATAKANFLERSQDRTLDLMRFNGAKKYPAGSMRGGRRSLRLACPERDDLSSNRHPARVCCLSMISAQTLRVCREEKPVSTFPDHAPTDIEDTTSP